MKKTLIIGLMSIYLATSAGSHSVFADDNVNQGGDGCNAPVAALVGGLVGALAGGNNKRGTGAAIGAGVAALACAAYNYSSQQTKTAEQVGQEYKAKSDSSLPPQPMLVSYQATVAPGTTVQRGSKVTFRSDIEIAPGQSTSSVEAKERLVLFDEKGDEMTSKQKVVNADTGQAGRYASEFAMKLPEGIPQGVYTVKKQVLLNNEVVKEVQGNLNVI